MTLSFTSAERDYLSTQRLGRLATVDGTGAPQNNPVGFVIDDESRVLIGGFDLAATRKFRNIDANPQVAFVVDDLASVEPWIVRGVEVRGRAEALRNVDPPVRGTSREAIRITPLWIASWGLEGRGRTVRRAPAAGDGASVVIEGV